MYAPNIIGFLEGGSKRMNIEMFRDVLCSDLLR